ncbi:DUF433 domain-containing protein [Anabaena sp. CS-542/02]|uniref:DUF433 domain-containing protein n=1 Tax=Anabaena sp. CS-542/02 TaxID=3021719 RepID=UPI00232F4F4A|nr:DUF433 domain-containing protein [Anabaena sp. CS-542/02]MDB9445635.1 DUF433 domain-containing protein [Anabaena sp. CS-542/02]
MISVILNNLADALTFEEIVQDSPQPTLKDVKAAITYAEKLTREEEVLALR